MNTNNCPTCNNSGNCPTCNGAGCMDCNYTGVCPTCNGDSKRKLKKIENFFSSSDNIVQPFQFSSRRASTFAERNRCSNCIGLLTPLETETRGVFNVKCNTCDELINSANFVNEQQALAFRLETAHWKAVLFPNPNFSVDGAIEALGF